MEELRIRPAGPGRTMGWLSAAQRASLTAELNKLRCIPVWMDEPGSGNPTYVKWFQSFCKTTLWPASHAPAAATPACLRACLPATSSASHVARGLAPPPAVSRAQRATSSSLFAVEYRVPSTGALLLALRPPLLRARLSSPSAFCPWKGQLPRRVVIACPRLSS